MNISSVRYEPDVSVFPSDDDNATSLLAILEEIKKEHMKANHADALIRSLDVMGNLSQRIGSSKLAANMEVQTLNAKLTRIDRISSELSSRRKTLRESVQQERVKLEETRGYSAELQRRQAEIPSSDETFRSYLKESYDVEKRLAKVVEGHINNLSVKHESIDKDSVLSIDDDGNYNIALFGTAVPPVTVASTNEDLGTAIQSVRDAATTLLLQAAPAMDDGTDELMSYLDESSIRSRLDRSDADKADRSTATGTESDDIMDEN